MATPTRTQVLDDVTVATIDTYLEKTPGDVLFERNVLFGALFGAAREPGQVGNQVAKVFKVPPGRVKRQAGREYWLPVANQRSTSTQTFRMLDTLKVAVDPFLTTQRQTPSYYTDFAAISWQEAEESSGPDNVIDIFQGRFDMTLRTLSEKIETDLWSTNDGISVGDPKGVLGIRTLLADTPTSGTVWNIDRSTETWQRNNYSNAAAAFSTNGLAQMRSMYTSCSGNAATDKPSVIVTTPAVWNAYTAQAESIHRITSNQTIDLGFEMAVYRGIPMIYSESCPAGRQYWMNLAYWYLCMPTGADFKTVDPPSPNDQLIALQRRIVVSLQWGCIRYDRQGVIYGFTDT